MIAAKAHSLVFGTRLGDGILSVWPSGGAVLTFQVGVVTDRLLGLPLEFQNLPDLTPLLPPPRSCRGFSHSAHRRAHSSVDLQHEAPRQFVAHGSGRLATSASRSKGPKGHLLRGVLNGNYNYSQSLSF